MVGHRFIAFMSFVALGFGGFYTYAASGPPTQIAFVPTSGAFLIMGILGSSVANTLRNQDERIKRLEERV